jgi:hypothetical protein
MNSPKLKLFPRLTLSVALGLPLTVSVVSSPVSLRAQAISGDLIGVVSDSTGAVVPNASVEVTNLGTGVKASSKTNANGEYRFSQLPAGHYSIQVTGSGLSGGYQDVQVRLNQTATANITASATASSTTIEVTGEAATIDTTTPQIQTTFETKQTQDLPTASVGLGVLNLSLLNAGVASSGGIGAGTGPSVSGQRPRNNNFTIEGVDNNNKSVTGPLLTVPNDAVQNFTVLQNQFSPEFGHSSGGQFNTILVSGTNKFHGRAYEYFQNRNLNAIDAATALSQRGGDPTAKVTNPRLDNNRFGGQIGGPILKDKLFFFSNHEYNPIGKVTSSSACAPTAAGYATISAMPGISANNLAVLKKYVPAAAAQSSDPNQCGGDDGEGHADVNGTLVPIGAVGFAGSQYNNTYTTANSLDYNLSQSDQLRFRYIYARNTALDFSAQLPSFWVPNPTRYHVITASEYHTFSPTVTNEFRLGYNRYYNTTVVSSTTFPGLNVFPNITIEALDGVNIGPDPNAPQYTIQNTYQAVDNLSWVKGKHNLKFGVEYRRYLSPQGFTQRARGDYYWYGLGEYLSDAPPTEFGERSTGNFSYPGDQTAVYAYGNDEFRITPNLTLNLGMRYEFTSVPVGARFQKFNAAASVPGLINFTEPQPQYKNFAPRIGFAYSPGTSGNTSIRGGFGMAYDVLYDNLGILSFPPQFSGTCDVVGGTQTSTCFWNSGTFLAGGALPAGPGTLQTFATVADQRAATSAYIPNQKLPYSETWNLGVQHVFAKKWTAEVRYVGTKGVHLSTQIQMNRRALVTATNSLPTYLSPPTQAQLDALPLTLAQIQSAGSKVPDYAAAGFASKITSFGPYGQSIYHGLQTQLTRSFTNGLQLQAAWTWSHAQDNSTADVFSTVLTPRRAQDWNNMQNDYSTSALDRRHRLTIEAVYDLPFFKNSNWFAKNVIGNWEIAPIYTLQSPEFATVQAGSDANLNGDSAGDRAIFNPNGAKGIGSGVTALKNSAGETVAYLAKNPNAQYIAAGAGVYSNLQRNTLALPRTNNWDLTVVKRLNITEQKALEFQAQALNVFNHSQYVPGSLNQVDSLGYTSGTVTQFLRPSSSSFNQPQLAFSNQPRTMQLVLKFLF